MSKKGFIEGEKKKCGHYCGNKEEICCRCHTPANKLHFLPFSFVCKICKGVMRKFVDGSYFQKCPACGRVVPTIDDRDDLPMCAPLANCGCERRTF